MFSTSFIFSEEVNLINRLASVPQTCRQAVCRSALPKDAWLKVVKKLKLKELIRFFNELKRNMTECFSALLPTGLVSEPPIKQSNPRFLQRRALR